MARKTTATPAAVEAVEEVKTSTFTADDGVVLTTFFLLIGAIVLVALAMQVYK